MSAVVALLGGNAKLPARARARARARTAAGRQGDAGDPVGVPASPSSSASDVVRGEQSAVTRCV